MHIVKSLARRLKLRILRQMDRQNKSNLRTQELVRTRWLASLVLGVGLWAQNVGAQAEISVFAAASLKTVLEEISVSYERDYGEAVSITVAGSSILARQIDLGAPADIFVSANALWMDHLENAERVIPGTRRDVAGNSLLLIQSENAPQSSTTLLEALSTLQAERVAMGLVEAVPAGIYGRSALEYLDIWDLVEPNVVQTDNVRAALALVALGEVEYGIVYKSDGKVEPRVKIVAEFPQDSHESIVYPAALVRGRNNPSAGGFLDYLVSEKAQSTFIAHGFQPVKASQ